MPLFKFNKIQKRRISVFFISFCMACGLWFLYALSKPMEYASKLYIQWTDIPDDLKENISETDTVAIQMKGNGWNLVLNDLDEQQHQVNVSLKQLNAKNYLVLNSIIGDLNQQLNPKAQIVSFKPDTLYFERAAQISKRVPVKLKYQFTFERFYGLSGPIQMDPAYVTIKGAVKTIDQIKYVETEVLKKNSLNSDFSENVSINLKNDQAYKIDPEWVKIDVKVARYTEKVLEIEPEIRNRTGVKVNIFPSRVKVTISTALNNYASIQANQIRAYIDLDEAMLKKFSRLPIKFEPLPNFIRMVKVEPQSVDFIIYP